MTTLGEFPFLQTKEKPQKQIERQRRIESIHWDAYVGNGAFAQSGQISQ